MLSSVRASGFASVEDVNLAPQVARILKPENAFIKEQAALFQRNLDDYCQSEVAPTSRTPH